MPVNLKIKKTELDNGEWLFEAIRGKEVVMDVTGKDKIVVGKELISLLHKRFPNDAIVFSK